VDLFAYCKIFKQDTEKQAYGIDQSNAARILGIANNSQVLSLVTRMSFDDNSLSSLAVLYAVYALSSLHLSQHTQALEFKSRAYHAICGSSTKDFATKYVLQRIVAVNLLAVYEVRVNGSLTHY
jgi:hypothetical protein